MKEREPVDNLEIAQTQSNRISSYLMQYPHLLVPHTSCSTVMIGHSIWVTSHSCKFTNIDIYRALSINKTRHSRVSTLFFTDTLCCDHSKLQAFHVTDIRIFWFSLHFGYDWAAGVGYLDTSNKKTKLSIKVGKGLPCDVASSHRRSQHATTALFNTEHWPLIRTVFIKPSI